MKEEKNKLNIKLSSAFICEIESYTNGGFNLNSNAPSRLCVIIPDREIAIDVEDKLEYKYLESKSGLYLTNKVLNENLIGKRVALFAAEKSITEIKDVKTLDYIKKIIKELNSGKLYPNANDVYHKEQFNDISSNSRHPIKIRRKEKKQK